MISRKVVLVTAILIIISPIFGVVLPDLLQSEEYIESLAEGLEPVIAVEYWTPFKEYTIYGLPEWLSYMISAILGYAIILTIYYAILRFVKARLNKAK